MGGLQRVLKLYGRIECSSNGKKFFWRWDYAKDEPRLEHEMTKEEIAASEKAKYEAIFKQQQENK